MFCYEITIAYQYSIGLISPCLASLIYHCKLEFDNRAGVLRPSYLCNKAAKTCFSLKRSLTEATLLRCSRNLSNYSYLSWLFLRNVTARSCCISFFHANTCKINLINTEQIRNRSKLEDRGIKVRKVLAS